MKFIQGMMFDECDISSSQHLQSEFIKRISLGVLRSDQVKYFELATVGHRWSLSHLLAGSSSGSCEMGDVLVESIQNLHYHCISKLT